MAILLPPKFETIPDFAADLRSNVGKTQQDVANLIGKPRTHISKYENGRMLPPAGYLAYLLTLHLDVLRTHRAIEAYKTASIQELNKALREYPTIARLQDWGELANLANHYLNEPNNRPNHQMPLPYRGLAAFGLEDRDLFFGRDTFIQRLLHAVEQRALVTIVGASGSGKSSVVFAGLVPALLERPNEQWFYATFRPAEDPFLSAANAFIPLLEPDLGKAKQLTEASNLAAHLRKSSHALSEYLLSMQQGDPDQRLLIVIDQFEEIFTLVHSVEAQQQFLDALLAIIETTHRVSLRLVLTLRADFLEQALSYPPWSHALQDTLVLLGPMNRTELTAAIEKPAARYKVTFEAKLVDRLLDDAGATAGNLPLLEFALTELWQYQRQQTLTHVAYEEIGQAKGALGDYAEKIYQTLSVTEQPQARRIFVQLINPGVGVEDTRRQATRTELMLEWPLVTKLATQRLVITNQGEDAGQPETVELVHEALIRNWDRLKIWMDEVRTFRAWQERLRFALVLWEDSEYDDELLLRGAPLTEAERWLVERGDGLGQAEHDYVHASVAFRNREHTRAKQAHYLRWGMVTIGILLLGVLLWLGGALVRPWWLTQCLPQCPNANLSRLDLSGTNLSTANLHGADLSETVLSRTDLSEADLGESDLREAQLDKSDLHGADLQGANMSEANLTEAALWGAILISANLNGTNLSGADLNWAEFHDADIDENTQIAEKWRLIWEIVNHKVGSRNLLDVDLSNANLNRAYLQGANLRNANLYDTKLWGADLSKADLRGANLIASDLNWADLNFAKIDDATQIADKWRLVWEIVNHNRREWNLYETDLSKAELHQANLENANLYKADLRETHLWGAILTNADLRLANLNKADLTSAILSFSKLNGADLSGANLTKVNLTDAVYDRATIWPAGFDPEAEGAKFVE